jgi:hypothetical protein
MLTPTLQLAGVIMVAALASSPCFAQSETDGFPEDWTHHHVVFSDPGSLHDASGRASFDAWYKVVTDPRFTYQQHKRGEHRRPDSDQDRDKDRGDNGLETPPPLDRDWSASLGGAGVAPGMFPAKWTFSTTAAPSCTDFVVFPVNKAGVSGSQPNIVGYKNLYVNAGATGFCSGLTAPTVLFSYFVGTGTVQTSPVLGPAVGQIAYVESIPGGSKFHVLKGAGTGGSNGTIAAPVAPGAGNTASDAAVTLNAGVSVTRSSPFYDYGADVAYVGDDGGKLHKFTPVFNGTPAEVTTGGWPVTVSTQTGKILTGPVHDSRSGKVYVGDSQGYLYSVSAAGAVTPSGQLGSGTGIVEPPFVDPSSESLYVFVGDNAGGTASAVFVFDISSGNITSGSTGSTVSVGTGSTTVPLYGGAFDNIYFTSAIQTQPAGNLYVCGNAGGNPTLYKIPITYSGGPILGSVVTGPVLASSNVGCSPLTEFHNSSATPTDWLFGGVSGNSCGAGTGAGGCVMSFNITTGTAPTIGPWTPSTPYTSTSEVVDTKGQLQKCTGGGCLIAGATSGATTPVWTTGAGTTTDGTTTNASSIGTVSANSAVGGATVTVGTLTLTASAAVKATGNVTVDTTLASTDTVRIGSLTYSFASRRTPVLNATHWVYRSSTNNCTTGCAAASVAQIAANLEAAINRDETKCATTQSGTCYFTGTGGVTANTTVVATGLATATISLSAITPGTSGNSITMACTAGTGTFSFNGGGACTNTTAVSFTGGSDGSSTAPNFQWTGGSGLLTTATLASNIASAAAGNSANVALTYTSGNTFTASGTGTNAGAAGNGVAIGGTLTGFAWSPTGHLAGGNNALTWTFQSASNGQTTAAEATGTSGIVIDNTGTSTGEASIYFGTLSGTGATNAAVKMTQAGLQ